MSQMSTSVGTNDAPSEADVFRALNEHDDFALSIPELSDLLGCSDPTVRKRLTNLEENGLVQSKRFGSGKAWRVVQEPVSFDEIS
jgi:predicted ArsR family transcriptional regulator